MQSGLAEPTASRTESPRDSAPRSRLSPQDEIVVDLDEGRVEHTGDGELEVSELIIEGNADEQES
jgi:hypothetical protein